MYRYALALLLLSVACSQVSFGQASATGAINGTVTDPSGQVVAGAKVTLRNEATNITTAAMTNIEGQYRFLNLLPSVYTLTVEFSGFKSVGVAPFRVNVNQTMTEDVALQLGELAQHVEVSAQSELVQRTTVELSTVMQEKVMRDLPLNGRNYTQLISLTPGANGTRINGQWADGNGYMLDGGSNTSILGASSAYIPILDTIQEFTIQAHSDKAEFGGFLGATISAVTRSGGNRFTGSAWEFVRNDILTARNPITHASLSSPPAFRQNQFGGTFGGPVLLPKVYDGRNRTFFFFAYERFAFRRADVQLTRVPTANEFSGNFSDSVLGRAIFDPATTRSGEGGTVLRDQFPGNTVPAARIDKMAQGYLKLMVPTPNYFDPGNVNVNRIDVFPVKQNKNDYSIRLDHRFRDQDNVWFRFSQTNDLTNSLLTALVKRGDSRDRRNIGVNWTHLFSPTLFLDSRFFHSGHPFKRLDEVEGGSAAVVAVGFSQAKIDRYNIPDFLGVGAFNTPYLNGKYQTLTNVPYGFSESFSWIKGRHSAKFGFQLSRKTFTNVALGHHYTFNLLQTADPQKAGSTGTELASLLLGLPNSISYYDGTYTEEFSNWGVYAQDEWKLRPNLTLSVGLRYDTFPLPNFTQGTISGWDWKTGEWLIGGSKLPPACDTAQAAPCIPGDGNLAKLAFGDKIRLADYPGIRNPIRDNFGPRVSAAWSPTPKTVLRGGYGLYFDTESSTAQEAQNSFGAWPSNNSIDRTYNGIGVSATTVKDVDSSVLAAVTSGVPWGTVTYFWDPKKKNAASHQWNIDVQRELRANLLMTVAYVGSVGRRLDLNLAANTSPTPGPGTAAEVNSRRPFSYYGRDTLYGTDLGRNSYNALQVKVDKRFSDGLQGLISYTWSKVMDNGTDGWYSGNPQNPYNLTAEHGVSNSDRTHILRISGIYELPFGKGKRWAKSGPAAYLIGGWQFNTINTLQTGTPVVLSVSGDIANVGNLVKNYARPNVIGDPSLSDRSMNLWFNTAAFAVPVLSFGNAGRGLVRNPAFYNSDLSLFKNVPIKESVTLQLRVEAFNAFNIQNPGNANGNASTGNRNFGRITSVSGSPRDVQLALKLTF